MPREDFEFVIEVTNFQLSSLDNSLLFLFLLLQPKALLFMLFFIIGMYEDEEASQEDRPLISYQFQISGLDIGNTSRTQNEKNILALKKASKITVMLTNIFQLWVQKVFPSPHVEQYQFVPKVVLSNLLLGKLPVC